jgi:eukaryotic-like serine/threonine-protein kinase
MTPERWRKVEEIYHSALKVSAEQRAAYLQQACASDSELRLEVESLLAQGDTTDSLLRALGAKIVRHDSAGYSLLGHRIGCYEIISLLGVGGMGEVYEARDSKLGRTVAIKVLPAAFTNDPERLSRFQREARLLAALNHPNIATIYGLEQFGDMHFLVMELVPGQMLAQLLSKGPLPVDETIRIARQIAEALEAAHEKGVIHRDLKPANVKVTPEGRAKLLDFGLAKAFVNEVGVDISNAPTLSAMVSEEGRILGTPSYMSPEQARGKPVDKRTDIWAFGCVLYEMLTGSNPFARDTLSDTIAAILAVQPEWRAVPETVPASIRRLLRRCFEKDSRSRLRDIGDALIELDGTDVDSPVSPSASQVGGRGNRERFAWILAAILLVAFSSMVLLRVWTAGVSPGSNASPSFARVTSLTSGGALNIGPAISPDGKWVAYLSDRGGPMDLWVKFAAGGEAVNLTGSTGLELPSRIDLGGLAISPDGANIAFDAGSTKGTPSNQYDAWIISAPLGGTPRKLVQRGRALRWSPDGTKIVYVRPGASAGDALFVADADGGNPREIVPTHGGMHLHWPAWSRDGRYIYFNYTISTSNSEPTSIYRVPVAAGPIEPVVVSERRAEFASPTPDGLGVVFAANPTTAELGLWWQSLGNLQAAPRALTNGVGEYTEPSLSGDGRRMVATLYDLREALVALPTTPGEGSDAPHGLTDGYGGDLDPALSRRGDRLVFSSARSGNRNLWTVHSDGTEARPLTSSATIDERPAYSPDGTRIAFVSARDRTRGIWVMSADGGAARLLAKAQVFDSLSWSPDGQEIVYTTTAGDVPGLSIVRVKDGAVRRLSTPGPATGPQWSPSSDVIAYIEAKRGSPDTPNSSRVAFVNSSGEPVLTTSAQSPNVLNGFLAWSPEGRVLAAVIDPGAKAGAVWAIDFAHKESWRKVTDLPLDVRLRGAAWSPDGKTLIVGQIRRASSIVLFE